MKATTTDRNVDHFSARLVDTIAAHDGTDPLDLEPLYDVVDLEALGALLHRGTNVRVSFEYGDHTVVVDGDCTVLVDGHAYDGTSTAGC